MEFSFVIFGVKIGKKHYIESSVSKLSHENMILGIFTQKHDKLKFHPCIEVSSMEKMIDDFFVCGHHHPWIKRIDKDYGVCTWTMCHGQD